MGSSQGKERVMQVSSSTVWANFTSLGRKGLKKQSSSLRRLMVRLPLVEAITSFTDERTKVMELCWELASGSHVWWLHYPATRLTGHTCGLAYLQEFAKESPEMFLIGLHYGRELF